MWPLRRSFVVSVILVLLSSVPAYLLTYLLTYLFTFFVIYRVTIRLIILQSSIFS